MADRFHKSCILPSKLVCTARLQSASLPAILLAIMQLALLILLVMSRSQQTQHAAVQEMLLSEEVGIAISAEAALKSGAVGIGLTIPQRRIAARQ